MNTLTWHSGGSRIQFVEARYEKGRLVGVVDAPFDEDPEEYCAALQDYIGDAFDVEPLAWRDTASIPSFVLTRDWIRAVEAHGNPRVHGVPKKGKKGKPARW